MKGHVHGGNIDWITDVIEIKYVDVQSKSDPDVTHKVKIMFGDTYSCDCKGYKYSNKCWHITQVKEKKEKEQEKEATIAELERDHKEGNL
jgi:hypothetical protein